MLSTQNEKHQTRNIKLGPWSSFQILCGMVRVSKNNEDWALLVDEVKHQFSMLDFIPLCIAQCAVHYSFKRCQKFIDRRVKIFLGGTTKKLLNK